MFVLRPLILGILLQHLSCTTCDSGQTYYIKASEDSPCASQPCLTLSEFAHNTTKSVKTDMVLQFGDGNHILNSRLTFSNTKKYSMISKGNNSVIACGKLAAGFTFENVSLVMLTNLTFIRCGNNSRSNAVLQISQVNLTISTCTFLHSKGRVIEASHANITTRNCTLEYSSAGVITTRYNTIMLDVGSVYAHNNFSTTLLYLTVSNATFTNSSFCENFAIYNMILIRSSTLTLNQCEMTHNNVMRLVMSNNSTFKLFDTKLTYNFAMRSIFLIQIRATNISINNSTFAHNVAQVRANVLHVSERSTVESHATLIIFNNTSNYSYNLIDIRDSKCKFGEVYYFNNTGSIFLMHSKAIFTKQSQFQNHKQVRGVYSYGGAITSIASIIRFQSRTSFYNHDIIHKKGGAVYAFESRIYTNGDTLFCNNKARRLGGGLYLDQSDFICQKKCTFIGNTAIKGGAIYAINSIITVGTDWNKYEQNFDVKSSLFFVSNSADEGGAIYLEGNSKLRMPRGEDCTYELNFDSNVAKLGAAIFVNDYTNVCNYSTCFIQAPSLITLNPWNGRIEINNTSENTTIYGGLLDRCIAKRIYSGNDLKITKGIDYIKRVTNFERIKDMITSDPVRVCHCKDEKVNCDQTQTTVKVKRGETFEVSVAAVDQVNHTVNASIVITSTQKYRYRLGIGQSVQKTHNGCRNLTLKVSSLNDSVDLILYPEGPCHDTGISKVMLKVNFKNCTCPIGFQPLKAQEDCLCGCDEQIKTIVKTCNTSSMTMLRQGDFWINYINDTNKIDYLIYPHCPYDYCVLSTNNINLNLNIPDGVDAQCALNRTGLLCSSCKPGLSLSFGSSLCLLCPKDWPKHFVIIVLGAIVSGIVLVTVILVLNLTVAFGTLNGLIFYANVVASNKIIYSPLTKSSFFSVFIAWLNLELGLDTCFYNGLDTYSKIWLQFVFPAYLIAILFIVIIVSKYSSKFAKLIGKRNPIATLATLILLSYMKFLRNIIDVFSVASLKYPDGSHKILWLPDANIEYLEGKHIPLFLMAVAIVAVGLPYTVFLLTWQWLLQTPDYKLFKWIRYTRLNLFMDANVAAYRPKHRYWSGLLLLIRVALYLEIAYNNSNKANASFLATGLIAACLLFLKAYGGKVYKKKMVDFLDSFTYLNLLILSIAQLYNQNNKTGQMIAAKTSVSAAFLQLLFVFIYHTLKTLLEIPSLSRLNSSLTERVQDLKRGELHPLSSQDTQLTIQTITTGATATSTVIEPPGSKEPSLGEVRLKQTIISERVTQSITSEWVESNGLREPLLQNEL